MNNTKLERNIECIVEDLRGYIYDLIEEINVLEEKNDKLDELNGRLQNTIDNLGL